MSGDALAVAVDISDSEQVDSMVRQTLAAYGRVDVLVNNAGIGQAVSGHSARRVEPGAEGQSYRAVPVCPGGASDAATGLRGIVNVALISGQRGGTGRAAYAAAKAGVILLTRVMAVELAAKGIAVNAISPGPTETDQVRQCHDAATRAAYYERLPMRRYAQPQETAEAALFLASDEASFVNGHILDVDGGFDAAGLIFEPPQEMLGIGSPASGRGLALGRSIKAAPARDTPSHSSIYIPPRRSS
jgi:3-oxoacyl-[acyl-carrier protein] reductase